jgi:type IV secretory pathway TrbF-like protein
VDPQLTGCTVMVLGPGDDLDGAILRSLADAGATTLATSAHDEVERLHRHNDQAHHWTFPEPNIDANVAARLRRFLEERGLTPDAVVMHIDVIETLQARGPINWWRFRKESSAIRAATVEALLAAIAGSSDCQIVLLYRLAEERERAAVKRWLARTAETVYGRARDEGTNIHVDAVIVGPEDSYAGAADAVITRGLNFASHSPRS